jgi:hypothetical protein
MAGEDLEYTDHLHQQACSMIGHGQCIGVIHVHHAPGRKGIGQRNPDDTGKPLCAGHHTQRHALSGPFKGWTKETIRKWERETAERYRRLYLGTDEEAGF